MALLFLAFALFAVGQAAVHRNSTQSAADAAALAAAQAARDEMADDLERAIATGNLTAVADLLGSTVFESPRACAEARRFAAKNEAKAEVCQKVLAGSPGYRVSVVSQRPLGKTEVEGTEGKYARAEATAVIESRCSLRDRVPEPEPSPSRSSAEEENAVKLIEFDCDGEILSIDSADFEVDIADFFSVHLRD